MALTRILLATGAATVTSAYLYGRYLHQSFARQVHHRSVDATGRKAAVERQELETLPNELLKSPQKFRIVHDRDEKKLANREVFNDNNVEELFTQLVRRDMAAFSKLPQSWMLSMLAQTPEQRNSFQRSHLLAMNYEVGDLFCGFYRVIKRDTLKVEIDMEPPPGAGPLAGRLVISLNQSGDDAFLRTETLQWIQSDSKVALPLERAPIRFMHEMASWWLLVSGAAYLQSLVSEN